MCSQRVTNVTSRASCDAKDEADPLLKILIILSSVVAHHTNIWCGPVSSNKSGNSIIFAQTMLKFFYLKRLISLDLGLELLHWWDAVQNGNDWRLWRTPRLPRRHALRHQQLRGGRQYRFWANCGNSDEHIEPLGYLDCCYWKRCLDNSDCSDAGMVCQPYHLKIWIKVFWYCFFYSEFQTISALIRQ